MYYAGYLTGDELKIAEELRIQYENKSSTDIRKERSAAGRI